MKHRTNARKLDLVISELHLHRKLLLQLRIHQTALAHFILRSENDVQPSKDNEALFKRLVFESSAQMSEFDVDLRDIGAED